MKMRLLNLFQSEGARNEQSQDIFPLIKVTGSRIKPAPDGIRGPGWRNMQLICMTELKFPFQIYLPVIPACLRRGSTEQIQNKCEVSSP